MVENFVAIDLETTGLDAKNDRIIEIGAVKYLAGERNDSFATFINPRMNIPERITELTGISDEQVADAPFIEDIIGKLMEFIGELPILGHNVQFDFSFLKHKAVNMKLKFEKEGIDTYKIAKALLAEPEKKGLESLCDYYGIVELPRHRAVSDAAAAATLYFKLTGEAQKKTALGELSFDDADKLLLAKPLICHAKKEGPITKKQIELLKKLHKLHSIEPAYEIESLTKNQASRNIDIIYSTYGRM